MSQGARTRAFLHAHGLQAEPRGLTAALRAAVASVEARYHAEPGEEGLTFQEAEAIRSGGLVTEPDRESQDPLLRGVVAYASLLQTGLTTAQAARRLGVSDARVRQRLADRTLLGIRDGRTWRLPLFQFTEGGGLPGWSEVCPRVPPAASVVAVERWLSLPHPDLVAGEDAAPLTPRRWLAEGRPPGPVRALAAELD